MVNKDGRLSPYNFLDSVIGLRFRSGTYIYVRSNSRCSASCTLYPKQWRLGIPTAQGGNSGDFSGTVVHSGRISCVRGDGTSHSSL